MKIISSFIEAANLLTALPPINARHTGKDVFGKAVFWHPIVGMLIGLLTAAFYWLAHLLFPVRIAAILAVVWWFLLTGGLHLDGVSDCCDGFFYQGNREKRLLIMKDVHHGTFAVLGVLSLVLLKIAAIETLTPVQAFYLFPLIGSLARLGTVYLLRLPTVNAQGMAAAMKSSLPKNAQLLTTIAPLLLALIGLATGLTLFVIACLCWFLTGRLAMSKIGGINGDVLGFSIEMTECVLLLACTMLPKLISAG